jgi:ribosomal protein S18 acetylase RimI-like enzyme
VTTIRRATDDDAAFLGSMLAVAADWRPGTPRRTVAEVMAVPDLAHYVSGWLRPGDAGFVAEDGGPVGAAWWRFLPAEDPGFGFVDATIPEVAIGVAAGHRGRGTGALLLGALVRQAGREGLPGLSLSVETDNPAVGLYRRFGFQVVGGPPGSLTMVRPREAPR